MATTKKSYRRGGTTTTYETDRRGPGETIMRVIWSNPDKARRAQERTAAKARREEARRQKAAARAAKRKPYSGSAKKTAKRR